MNVMARLMLRGVTVALLVGAPVPAAAAGTDVEGPSEQSLEEGSTDAVATRLVLRPVCSSDELHRFAVVNESGPGTRFTVEVAAPASEPLAIAPGETVRFWVHADHGGPVEISWPDGSASATAAQEACTSGNEVPAAEPTEQERAERPVEPAPWTATERNGPARPEEPPPDTPSADSTAEPAPRAADPPAPAGVPAPGEPATPEAPADGIAGSAAPGALTTPRPRPSGAAFACPDNWVAVDGDGDGTIDGGDDCELVVETGADGGSTGTALTTAALIITLGLLIASVGAGAVSRRAMR